MVETVSLKRAGLPPLHWTGQQQQLTKRQKRRRRHDRREFDATTKKYLKEIKLPITARIKDDRFVLLFEGD